MIAYTDYDSAARVVTIQPVDPYYVTRAIELTAKAYGLMPRDILGRSRVANIAEARQVAMFLTWAQGDYTVIKIGEIFGRDHSTVSHAHQTIGRRMMRERDLLDRVEGIAEGLKSE